MDSHIRSDCRTCSEFLLREDGLNVTATSFDTPNFNNIIPHRLNDGERLQSTGETRQNDHATYFRNGMKMGIAWWLFRSSWRRNVNDHVILLFRNEVVDRAEGQDPRINPEEQRRSRLWKAEKIWSKSREDDSREHRGCEQTSSPWHDGSWELHDTGGTTITRCCGAILSPRVYLTISWLRGCWANPERSGIDWSKG